MCALQGKFESLDTGYNVKMTACEQWWEGASLVAQTVKNLLTMREIWIPSLGQEDLLEKEMATHPLGGKIPWRREWLSTPTFLPGEFHGQRNLAGYRQTRLSN